MALDSTPQRPNSSTPHTRLCLSGGGPKEEAVYPPRPMLWLVETYNPLRLWCAITYPIRSAMAFAHKSDYKVAVLGGGGVGKTGTLHGHQPS